MRLSKWLPGLIVAVTLAATATVACADLLSSLGPIAFDGTDSRASNFRFLNGESAGYGVNATGNYFYSNSDSPTTLVYDSTPSDSYPDVPPTTLANSTQFRASPVTVAFDMRMSAGSIGVIFSNPLVLHEAGIMALMNVTNSTDRIRISNPEDIVLETHNFTYDNSTYDYGVSLNAAGTGSFVPMAFTYATSGTHALITVAGPSHTETIDLGAGTALANNPEIAFRLAPGSGGEFDMMNLRITGQVPEPTAVVMLLTGLLGLLAYAWRKRR